MAMSEEKKALIEKLKAHGYKESSVKRLSVEKLEKKLAVEEALAGAKANKKVVEDNVVKVETVVVEGTEVIEVVEAVEVIDPDFDMPDELSVVEINEPLVAPEVVEDISVEEKELREKVIAVVKNTPIEKLVLPSDAPVIVKAEAKQCTGRNCTTTTGYDHSPECVEDYDKDTKIEDEEVPEKKDFMKTVAEQVLEENEKEAAKKELYNEIQAAKKLAITHKYMFKARFLTLLDLGMVTDRPNMHFIHSSYMRMFPRPHANNYNGDIISVYEKFMKYFNERK